MKMPGMIQRCSGAAEIGLELAMIYTSCVEKRRASGRDLLRYSRSGARSKPHQMANKLVGRRQYICPLFTCVTTAKCLAGATEIGLELVIDGSDEVSP